jgi:type I restriction enzyme S subunit
VSGFEHIAIGTLVSSIERWNPDEETSRSFRYVDIGSIDSELKQVECATETPTTAAPSRARQLLAAGDVLVSTVRPNLNAVACVDAQFDGAIGSTGFCVLRPVASRLASSYLFHWTRTPEFIRDMTAKATGQSYPAVSDRVVKESSIPLPMKDGEPDLGEQRRIAAILDKADALRRKAQQAIDLTDDLIRSTFLDMFGDPVTNPKEWQMRALGDLLEFLTSGSRGWAKYYAPEGDLFIRIQNVGRNRLLLDDKTYVAAPVGAEAERTRVRPRDLLLSITADLGRTAVIPDNFQTAHINQHLAILRLSGLNPYFAAAFLDTEAGRAQFSKLNRAAVKAGLNFDDIRSVELPVPSKTEQDRFEEAYHKIIRSEEVLRARTATAEALFQAALQRAFTGGL